MLQEAELKNPRYDKKTSDNNSDKPIYKPGESFEKGS
jgi:hypothetical protein